MTTAFQRTAFQNNAFQIDVTPAVSRGGFGHYTDYHKKKNKDYEDALRLAEQASLQIEEDGEIEQGLLSDLNEEIIGLEAPQIAAIDFSATLAEISVLKAAILSMRQEADNKTALLSALRELQEDEEFFVTMALMV